MVISMKNVPVKFRAKNNFSGEIIYGDLLHYGTKVAIRYQAAPNRWEADIVDPESVCQLIGYDADGNEVYEDDILINEKGTEFQAVLKGLSIGIGNCSYHRYLDDSKYQKYYRLKGKDYEEPYLKGDSDE